MLQDPATMFAAGEKTDDSDVRPVRLVAFSGKPVKHWWWDYCIFDRSGCLASQQSSLTALYRVTDAAGLHLTTRPLG